MKFYRTLVIYMKKSLKSSQPKEYAIFSCTHRPQSFEFQTTETTTKNCHFFPFTKNNSPDPLKLIVLAN